MEVIKDEYGRPCAVIGTKKEIPEMMTGLEKEAFEECNIGSADEELPLREMPNQDANQQVLHSLAWDIKNLMHSILITDDLSLQSAYFELCEDTCCAAQKFINNRIEG